MSINEINSLNSKIQRLKTILQKKIRIQEATTTELENARKEIATLMSEMEGLKSSEKKCQESHNSDESERKPLRMKFYKCMDCGKTFNSHQGLDGHVNLLHNQSVLSLCEICGKTLTD